MMDHLARQQYLISCSLEIPLLSSIQTTIRVARLVSIRFHFVYRPMLPLFRGISKKQYEGQ